MSDIKIQKIDNSRFKIPKHGKMKVDGIIYANDKLIDTIKLDESLKQVVNVACLPGIVNYSLAMPDIHWGYGFPIGGVAAFDLDEGIITPGGIGFDINCGVRLIRTSLKKDEVEKKIKELINSLFINIPTGVGSSRKDIKLSPKELNDVLKNGANWAIKHGFGRPEDLDFIEDKGVIPYANPDNVSSKALERGKTQLGTLGSGNHFVEVDYVEEIYDEKLANSLNIELNQIMITIHTGSRGLGHQVCTDYLDIMIEASKKYGIELPDRQLCCAPFKSKEGENYFSAMASAANFAFANRQIITHWIRESFEQVFKIGENKLSLDVVYDLCHNIAKIETHKVDGKDKKVCVHRKGATRAFPPGDLHLPEIYKKIGQPVIIPGDMGRYSYILVGTYKAVEETFASSCHGAGRVLSRSQAIKRSKGRKIAKELENKGIIVKSDGAETLAEEMPDAYKDVADVVQVVDEAGIAKKVAKLTPLGVIKG